MKIRSESFCTMPNVKSVTVALGDLQAQVDARVQSGAYDSISDVVRAGLQALDREEARIDAELRLRVQQALDDPQPSRPADQVFARLRTHHEARVKAAERGA